MHSFFHQFRDFGRADAAQFGRHSRGPGRGFGPFGAGFMGGFGAGAPGFFRSGRKLGSNELQVVLLALLAAQPSHGYELIKALEERSGGFYSPSPGMIYPALTYLEEVGYASVQAEGTRKLYRITDEGREHLRKNQALADAILSQLEQVGAKMGRLRAVFSGDADAKERDERGGRPAEIWLALRELKHALRSKRDVGLDEARRVAAILKRAAAEILERE